MTRILRFSPAPNGAQKTMDGESVTAQDKKAKTRKPAGRKAQPAAKPADKAEATAKPVPAAKYVAPDTTKLPPGIERMRAAREAKAAEPAPAVATAEVTPVAAHAPVATPAVERKPAEVAVVRVQAPVASATPHVPAPEAARRREPTRAEITERAYEIYRRRGMTPGNPEADWLQAERELRAELSKLPHTKL